MDAAAIERTKLYLPWLVGKPPDFVLEVASESAADHDVTGKRQLYAEIGVPEYWRFDRSGGDYYGEPLAGDRLVNGIYQPAPLSQEPDGILKGYSPALQLSLCWDPEKGEYLLNLEELIDARERAEADQHTKQVARRAEQAAREQAEARIQELEEELERRNRESCRARRHWPHPCCPSISEYSSRFRLLVVSEVSAYKGLHAHRANAFSGDIISSTEV